MRAVALQVLGAQDKSNDPYNALLLPKTASFQDARAAYKRLFILHPDKNPNLDIAAEAFKIVTNAFESIKASTAQLDTFRSEFDTAGAPTARNRWSAYTGAAWAPSNNTAPQTAPSRQQQPAQPSISAASKWGRPVTDAQRILKANDPPSGLKPASGAVTSLWKPLPSKEADPSHQHRHRSSSLGTEEKHSEDAQKATEEEGKTHGIATEDFYGGSAGKKVKKPVSWSPGHRRGSSAVGHQPPEGETFFSSEIAPPAGNHSRWSNENKNNPLAELLRNPRAAATLHSTLPSMSENNKDSVSARPKRPTTDSKEKKENNSRRRTRPRVVLDSDSEDIIEEDISGDSPGKKGDSSTSSQGWESDDYNTDNQHYYNRGVSNKKKQRKESEPSGNASKESSKNMLSVILAQQEAKAKLRAGVMAAQQARRTAAARRTFGRRGKGKSKQTKLKLAPVVA